MKLKILPMIFLITPIYHDSSAAEKERKKEVVCQQTCTRYEEKRDCRYFDDPRIPPVCTTIKVCVEWKEVCSEVQR